MNLIRTFFKLSVAILVGLIFALPASADWTASGQFNYTDRLYDLNGFTGTLVRPVREADVQVYDLNSSLVLASGATNSTGQFSIRVVDTQTRVVGVRVLASNTQVATLNFSVVDNRSANAVYSYSSSAAGVSGHNPTVDINFGSMTMPVAIGNIQTTDWSSQVFNTYDMGVLVADWVAHVDGARPTVLYTINWNPLNLRTGSSYNRSTNILLLSDDDAYDDPNILHEIGHYIEDEYGYPRSPGGSHNFGDDDQDPRLAYSEGFASFFGASTLKHGGRARPDIYQDRASFTAGTGGGFSVAYEAAVTGGATNEQAVTAALYDLIDDSATDDGSPGSDDDPLSALDSSIWAVIKQMRILSPSATQMEDFWDIWFSLGLGEAEGMATVFAMHSIHFSPDAQEPNDTPATSTPVVVGSAFLRNTFYRSGPRAAADEDWFRFTAQAGVYYSIEVDGSADKMFGRPDPQMWLISPDLSRVLADNDDPYDSTLNSQASTTAQDMAETAPSILWQAPADGVYFIYLRHSSLAHNLTGRYGTYHLRVSTLPVPTPQVSRVSEQRMLPGQSYQVLLTGTGFSRGAVVTTSTASIQVSPATWVAPSAMIVTITPSAQTMDGLYTITVTNPGGNGGGMIGAFEVSSSAQPPVMITEVNPPGGQVEIKNFGTVNAVLTSWSIGNGQPSTSGSFIFPNFTLAPGATVVVSKGTGTNTALNLYGNSIPSSWGWNADLRGDVSLVDESNRNVDFLRWVTSPVSAHSAPLGTGGDWLPPQMQAPPAGWTLSRADAAPHFRTARGLSWTASSMPSGSASRSNHTDSWEDNDQPRLCPIFDTNTLLTDLHISHRPSLPDHDWFGFVVGPGQEVHFTAAFIHALGDLNMDLFAPGEEVTPLLSATSMTDDENIILTAEQSTLTGGGIYRLRVHGASGAQNAYTLRSRMIRPVVSITATDSAASENELADTAHFTFTRVGKLDLDLPVYLAISGSASPGVDYRAPATPVIIPALSSSVTLEIHPLADRIAEGTEEITLTLVPNSAYYIEADRSATASLLDLPVDAWRYQYFSGNPPLSNDGDDADGDGLPNLLEYALGKNPTMANRSDLPAAIIEMDLGATYLTMNYQKDTSKTELIYSPQTSLDLDTWSDIEDRLLSVDGLIETRQARVLQDTARKFLLLKVTRR